MLTKHFCFPPSKFPGREGSRQALGSAIFETHTVTPLHFLPLCDSGLTVPWGKTCTLWPSTDLLSDVVLGLPGKPFNAKNSCAGCSLYKGTQLEGQMGWGGT